MKHQGLEPLEPILVVDLFPEILDALLGLLSGLPEGAWAQPTACGSWSVKDVAAHLLGDDIGILSRKRDGYARGVPVESWDELVHLVDQLNAVWVSTADRISPHLLCDLLRFTGDQVCHYFRSLDPLALGGPVSWAGPEPAPVWLDLAREYTERWHHQQHIRAAVGQPGLREARYLAPVLDAFVRALPRTYREVRAPEGSLVALTIDGPAGGRWGLRREGQAWRLYRGSAPNPRAEVVLDQDVAWRLFSRGMSPEEAGPRAAIRGDWALGRKVLDTVSIIA